MTPPERAEALLRRYFDACNAADVETLRACFTEDAVHWFPPGMPGEAWRGAEAIAANWARFVAKLDAVWTVDRLIAAPDGREAVLEYSNWTGAERLTRGVDWYLLTEDLARIAEVRGYFAAPVDLSREVNELAGFPYASRGYPTARPARG